MRKSKYKIDKEKVKEELDRRDLPVEWFAWRVRLGFRRVEQLLNSSKLLTVKNYEAFKKVLGNGDWFIKAE